MEEKCKAESAQPTSWDVRYREFQPGDEAAILDCLTDEYQDTYYRRDYYRPEYYLEMTDHGAMRVFLAQAPDGETAGFLLTRKRDCFPGQTELGTMIIRQPYRDRQLSEPLIRYAMDCLRDEPSSALFGHTQMFHTISQEKLYQLGLTPTGLLLSTILSAPLRHSYRRAEGQKLSWGVMVRPHRKRNAGALYIPGELHTLVAGLYETLKLPFAFARGGAQAAYGSLRRYDDPGQHTGTFVIDAYGPSVAEEIAAIRHSREADSLYTINLLLNASQPSAIDGYHMLVDQGFFFTGMQPACDGGEYLLMHHPMRVPVVFADFEVSAAFSGIVDMVREQYRAGGGK